MIGKQSIQSPPRAPQSFPQRTESPYISEITAKKLKNLMRKILSSSSKNPSILNEVANQLHKERSAYNQQVEPEITVTLFLAQQIKERKQQQPIEYSKLIQDFFKVMGISLQPYHEIAFIDIIKNIVEPPQSEVLVHNLWKEKSNTFECYCKQDQQDCYVQNCYKCGQRCHMGCFWSKAKEERYFQCPVCFMRNCLPHKPVDQVLFLGYLPYTPLEKVDYKIKFYLDKNRQNMNNIEVRCVSLNNLKRFQLTFPKGSIYIGGKILSQLQPLLSNLPSQKANSQWVQMNKFLLSYVNTVKITQNNNTTSSNSSDEIHNYLVMVISSKPISIPQLVLRIVSSKLTEKQSKKLLKKQFNQLGQIQHEHETISITCQQNGLRMKNPARSLQCTHYQPFDLESFIESSFKEPNTQEAWHCPICEKRAYDLQIDEYIQFFLSSHPNVKEIRFHKSGQIAFKQLPFLTENAQNVQNEQMFSENLANVLNIQPVQRVQPVENKKDLSNELKQEEDYGIDIMQLVARSVDPQLEKNQLKRSFQQRQIDPLELQEAARKILPARQQPKTSVLKDKLLPSFDQKVKQQEQRSPEQIANKKPQNQTISSLLFTKKENQNKEKRNMKEEERQQKMTETQGNKTIFQQTRLLIQYKTKLNLLKTIKFNQSKSAQQTTGLNPMEQIAFNKLCQCFENSFFIQ